MLVVTIRASSVPANRYTVRPECGTFRDTVERALLDPEYDRVSPSSPMRLRKRGRDGPFVVRRVMESSLHLARNQACSQCKRRKVKCDAVRPTCGTCLRSYLHASRAAQKHGGQVLQPTCIYGDDAVENEHPDADLVGIEESQTRTGDNVVEAVLTDSFIHKSTREDDLVNEIGAQTSTDTFWVIFDTLEARLKARIKELEGPSDMNAAAVNSEPSHRLQAAAGMLDGNIWIESAGSGSSVQKMADNPSPSWMILPLNWPKNLPAPLLLEHLIETWFSHAPLHPCILNRGRLLNRIRLPPIHPDFPHPSLLHAICAAASEYTAWVTSLPPEYLATALSRHVALGLDTESIQDFGLAQAEASQRATRTAEQTCLFGSEPLVFEILQSTLILSDYYYVHGFALQGLMLSAIPGRLSKALRLTTQAEDCHHSSKPSMVNENTKISKQEKLVTLWLTFVSDSIFSVCSYWSRTLDLADMTSSLPGASENSEMGQFASEPNPQTAFSQDLYTHHPIPDSLILVIKASILINRAGQWLRDAQTGNAHVSRVDIENIIRDCHNFHNTMPTKFKNIMRVIDSGGSFDTSILLIHILPHMALLMLFEHLALTCTSSSYSSGPTPSSEMDKSYNAIMGILYLIPSNYDVTLLLNSVLAFCLYTIGRVIAGIIRRMMTNELFDIAARYRSDLFTIQNILNRYGEKFAVGQMMVMALSHHLTAANTVASMSPMNAPTSDILFSNDMFDQGNYSLEQTLTVAEPLNRRARHDFFPCVHIDAFVEVIKPRPPERGLLPTFEERDAEVNGVREQEFASLLWGI